MLNSVAPADMTEQERQDLFEEYDLAETRFEPTVASPENAYKTALKEVRNERFNPSTLLNIRQAKELATTEEELAKLEQAESLWTRNYEASKSLRRKEPIPKQKTGQSMPVGVVEEPFQAGRIGRGYSPEPIVDTIRETQKVRPLTNSEKLIDSAAQDLKLGHANEERLELLRSAYIAEKNPEVKEQIKSLGFQYKEAVNAPNKQTASVSEREVSPDEITSLSEDEVFVFGSNLAGRHGKGAALLAKNRFGAKYGQGSGIQGQSYGIATKDENLKTLPLPEIEKQIDSFIDFAENNPDKKFLLTKVGTGLAGLDVKDIAPMFFKKSLPKNISVPKEFLTYEKKDNVAKQKRDDFWTAEEVFPLDSTEETQREAHKTRAKENLKFEKDKEYEEELAAPIPSFEELSEEETASSYDKKRNEESDMEEFKGMNFETRDMRSVGVRSVDDLHSIDVRRYEKLDRLRKERAFTPTVEGTLLRVKKENAKTIEKIKSDLSRNELLSAKGEGKSVADEIISIMESFSEDVLLSDLVKKIIREEKKAEWSFEGNKKVSSFADLKELPQSLLDFKDSMEVRSESTSGWTIEDEKRYEETTERFVGLLAEVKDRLKGPEKIRFAPALLAAMRNPDSIASVVEQEYPDILEMTPIETVDKETGEVEVVYPNAGVDYQELASQFSASLSTTKGSSISVSPKLAGILLDAYLDGRLTDKNVSEKIEEKENRKQVKKDIEKEYKAIHGKRLPKILPVKKKDAGPKRPQQNQDLNKLVAEGKAYVGKDGIYYIQKDVGLNRIAGTRPDGSIYVVVPLVKDLYAGKQSALETAGKFTAQALERLGIKLDNLKETFKTEKQFIGFVIRHEISHLKNKDKKTSFEVELRNSFSALSSEEKKSLRLQWWKESVDKKSMALKYLPFFFEQLNTQLKIGRWNDYIGLDLKTTKRALSTIRDKSVPDYTKLPEAEKDAIAKEIHRNLWLENEFTSSPRLKSVVDYKDAELVLNDILGYGPTRKGKPAARKDVSQAFKDMPEAKQIEIVQSSIKTYYHNNDLSHDHFPISYIANHKGSTQYSHLAEAIEELRNAPGVDEIIEYDVVDTEDERSGSLELFPKKKPVIKEKDFYHNAIKNINAMGNSKATAKVLEDSISNHYQSVVAEILNNSKNFGDSLVAVAKEIKQSDGTKTAKFKSLVNEVFGLAFPSGKEPNAAMKKMLYSLLSNSGIENVLKQPELPKEAVLKYQYQNTVREIFERLTAMGGEDMAASFPSVYEDTIKNVADLYKARNQEKLKNLLGEPAVGSAALIAALDDTNLPKDKKIPPAQKYMSLVRIIYRAAFDRGRYKTEERHRTKLLLNNLTVPAKAALAYQAYVNRTILDKDLFKKLSEHYKELNMNESDMFDLFINAGSNPTKMTAMLREKQRVAKHKEIDTFFAKLTDQKGKMDASAAREAILSFLEKENHKAYEAYAKDFYTKNLTPEQSNLFDALYQYEVQLKKRADVVSVADKAILLERGKEKRMAEEKGDDLASFLRSKGIDVPVEYQYAEKKEYTDFERTLAAEGAAIVVARSSWMEKIFEGIAKAFNADLVLTAGDYRSRYFPSSKDGKAKIVLNVSDKKAMPKVFAHELFHHVVAKALPAQYKAFQKAIADLYGMGTQFFNEEQLAEVFAEAVGEREFWDYLAKTIPGQTLGQKLAISLVKTVRSLWSAFHRKSDFFESHFAKDQMEPIYKLVADMVGHAYTRRLENPNSDEVKFYTPLGAATMKEIEAASKAAGNIFKGVWQKIFKPGTRTRQEFAENIHNLFVDMKAFYVKHRPRFAYADLGVDPAIRTLAHQIRNGWKVDANTLNNTVVKKHRPAFDNAATAYRDKVKAKIEAGKYVVGMDKANRPIYLDASTKAGAEYARTIIADAKRKYFEKMHDDLVRGQVDVTTQEGREEAGRLGYGSDIIEALTAYKEASDAIYARMVEFYPELEYNPAHYGQSIRWRNPSGDFVHSDIDWFTNPEFSKLEGNKRMLKPKDFDRTTEQIAKEEEVVYDTIDPSQLFLNYVSDAYKLIHFKDAIDKGSSAANPSVQWFSNPTAALKEGFVPVKDNAAKIFQVLNRTEGFKVLEVDPANPDKQTYAKDRNGNEMMFSSHRDAGKWLMAQMFNPNIHRQVVAVSKDVEPVVKGWRAVFRNERGEKVISREFPLEKTAKDWLNEHAGEYASSYPYVEPIFGYARTAEAGQLYFHPDFADMLNVLLAKDRIRANKYGRLLVDIKNVWTSTEFALSLFHAFTIIQEVVSARSEWQQLKNRDKGNLFSLSSLRYYNPKTAFDESVKIARLFKEIMQDPSKQDSPGAKKLEELLQTKDVDFVDAVKQFFLAGGLEGLDPTLQAHFHSMGNMRYTDPSGRISFKAMADSIKEVFHSELEKSPDHPLMAYLKTIGFILTEGLSAWLMEGIIPNMKLAAWLSEYTMLLEQYAEELQAGTITKEELARQAIFFVEDRFGEVNWDNAWMNPSFKTTLQIGFRSYTWFTGTFTAFGKAGIDVASKASYKAQGKEYKLGPAAYWAFNANIAHILSIAAMTGAYSIGAALMSGDEAETPEDTPLLTKLLFARIDKYDPTRRVAIPSYVTELWKVLSHTGMLDSEAEYTKLVSGRFSSLLGKSFELFKNEDWRGTIIANPHDNILEQTFDRLWHIAPTPIMLSAVTRQAREKGFDPREIGFAVLGIAEAPAAAKRTAATNLAYAIRRDMFTIAGVTPEDVAESNAIKRAMYAYQKGDSSKINALLKEGKISQTQFINAAKRLPVIMNKKNPLYEDQLTSALKQMTMDKALEVWEKMSDAEKKKHKSELLKKYSNLVARSSRSPEYKAAIREKMKEAGIIR